MVCAPSSNTSGGKGMPPAKEDYSSLEYWNSRYTTGESAGHVWYFGYDVLQPLLHSIVPEKFSPDPWSVLEIGCGDRPILPDLVKDPHFECCRAVGVDYSPAIVRQLRQEERSSKRARTSSEGITNRVSYAQADARALTYHDESFDLVLDKGTIDAMMCSDAEGFINARSICSEASRVTRPGGAFVIVSHMNPTGENGESFVRESLLPALLGQPAKWAWDIGVHFEDNGEEQDSAEEAGDGKGEEEEEAENSGPFVYVISKIQRRVTRSVKRFRGVPGDIPLKLHAY